MRIIAFITVASTIRDILLHLGEPTAPPRIAPPGARRSGTCSMPRRVASIPHAQPAPAYEFDQGIADQVNAGPVLFVA